MDANEARRRLRGWIDTLPKPGREYRVDVVECVEALIDAAIVDHDHDMYNAAPHGHRTKPGRRVDAVAAAAPPLSASPRVDAMDVLLYTHQALVDVGITGYDPLAAHHGVDVLASMYRVADAQATEAARLLDTERERLGRCRDALARLLRESFSSADHSAPVEAARTVLRNTSAGKEEPVGAVLLRSEPQQSIRCVECWARLGRDRPADEARLAVVVVEGRSLCAICAHRPGAVWS